MSRENRKKTIGAVDLVALLTKINSATLWCYLNLLVALLSSAIEKNKECYLPHFKRPTRRLFERGGYVSIPLQKQAVLEANFDCF